MHTKPKVLVLASVASMIDQFNLPNIRLLLDMGYEVHVACNFKKGNTCDNKRICKLVSKLHKMHVVCHQWDCPRSLLPPSACARAFWQMMRLLEHIGFAWIHGHSPVGGALARIAAHKRRIRFIYTAHGFHFYKGAPLKNWLLYYPAEKLLAHWTDVLITVNKEDEQFARQHLRGCQIQRISGIGVETRRFQSRMADQQQAVEQVAGRQKFCRTYQIPEYAKILLSVGELSRRKNHQAVLAAVPGLASKDVYYIICGQGEQEEKLRKQASALGIAKYVRILGYVEDVKSLYALADLFVFPSLQEGLPVALMEAMAAGLACIASDIRGNRELIDDRGGRLFSPGKIMQLQEQIEEFLKNPYLRKICGKYNQEKIERFSLDIVQQQMRKIYGMMKPGKISGYGKKKEPGQIPEISVIMAVYQAADGQVLRQAVRSICLQSYSRWELLICDDGSTDGTWELLVQIAEEDSRIRLLRLKKNHKAGYARNKCINAARGKYVAVMDADDISAPERLQRQVDFLKSHPKIAFVGSRGAFFVRRIGDEGECYPFCRYPQASDFLFSLPYVHASLMFRKEALEQVQGYDSRRRAERAEDYDLLLRLYKEGRYGANLDEVLYYIRRDKKQFQRRKYRYRFHEAYVKYKGFQKLSLMPKGIFYAIKPLFVGLLPHGFVKVLQQRYYGV